jgi:hypothetical protein
MLGDVKENGVKKSNHLLIMEILSKLWLDRTSRIW